MDPYYSRLEVSNSDLSEIKKIWMPEAFKIDLEKAYADGTLIDCMITEPACKIDYFKYQVIGYPYQFTKEDFEKAQEMKKAFFKDPLCAQIAAQAAKQKVSVKNKFDITYEDHCFQLPVRCKWDFFVERFDMSGDLKSTASTSQKQFEECVRHFSYDRQAAWYLDIEGRSNFIFMAVSKVNFKIFKVPVKRDSEIYKEGKRKYQELAFQYWYLFGDVKQVA